jgi:hypothetical protein
MHPVPLEDGGTPRLLLPRRRGKKLGSNGGKFCPDLSGTRQMVVSEMIEFKKVDWARKILNLPAVATLDEIKEAYRKLSLRYHPDRSPEGGRVKSSDKFREIIRARDILLKYLASYRFAFSEEEFKKHLGPESRDMFKHFFEDYV